MPSSSIMRETYCILRSCMNLWIMNRLILVRQVCMCSNLFSVQVNRFKCHNRSSGKQACVKLKSDIDCAIRFLRRKLHFLCDCLAVCILHSLAIICEIKLCDCLIGFSYKKIAICHLICVLDCLIHNSDMITCYIIRKGCTDLRKMDSLFSTPKILLKSNKLIRICLIGQILEDHNIRTKQILCHIKLHIYFHVHLWIRGFKFFCVLVQICSKCL